MTTVVTVSDDRTGFSGDNGFDYLDNDESVTVVAGVAVTGFDGGNGVSSDKTASRLFNNGHILGTEGVEFSANTGSITNNASGDIIGISVGVLFLGASHDLVNHGLVRGGTGSGVFFGSGSTLGSLTNDGEIYGHLHGVRDRSSDGANIMNSGTITSDHTGILIETVPGVITTITNSAGGAGQPGVISGSDAAIVTTDGRLTLINRGTLSGVIDCNATDQIDFVRNLGTIQGAVHLGSGADTYTGLSTTLVQPRSSAGPVFGEAGSDSLLGGILADTLNGGANNDLLIGGLGRDVLIGGLNQDRFDFNRTTDSRPGASRDVISDFHHSEADKIDVHDIDANTTLADNQDFRFIGAAAFTSTAGQLRFANHILAGDVNGDGRADFEVFVSGVDVLSAGVGGDLFL